MFNVQGILTQKKEYESYVREIPNIRPGGENYCDTTNGVEDWMYRYEKNLFTKDVAYCSKPDVSLCEIDKNFPATASWVFPRGPNIKFPDIICQYDAQKIKNLTQVNKWVDKFGYNRWYDKLMFEFCSLLQNDCNLPNQSTTCSFKNSRSIDATYCSLWFNGLKKNFISQTFMNFICKKYPKLYECRCINRNSDPLFLSIKEGDSKVAFGDSCWYSPCTNEFQNFIPNEVLESKCPDTVCATILNFIDVKSVKMKDLSTVINCNSNLGNPYFFSEEFWKPILNYIFDNHVVLFIGFFIILGLATLFFSSLPIFFYRRIPRHPDPTEDENIYDLVIN